MTTFDLGRARRERAFRRALDAYTAMAGIWLVGPLLGLLSGIREAVRSYGEPVDIVCTVYLDGERFDVVNGKEPTP